MSNKKYAEFDSDDWITRGDNWNRNSGVLSGLVLIACSNLWGTVIEVRLTKFDVLGLSCGCP